MDLHALYLDRSQKRASVRACDARGITERELLGPAFERVTAAAQPFFDWAHTHIPPCERTPKDATLLALSLDALAHTLRLGYLAERSAATPPSAQTPVLAWCDGDYRAAQGFLRDAARAAVREVNPRLPDPPGLTPESRWEHLYQHGGDGWELGRAAPPLARYLTTTLASQLAARAGQVPLRALVVGSGRGHEAVLLAQVGQLPGVPFAVEVVAVDVAPSAIEQTRARAESVGVSPALTALEADLFTLATTRPEHRAAYDLVVEHCCFCAIEPQRRDEYVQAVAELLKPGGQLVGLFYCHDFPGGPPYGATPDEIRARFAPRFTFESETVPEDSILTRAGQELLVVASRT